MNLNSKTDPPSIYNTITPARGNILKNRLKTET